MFSTQFITLSASELARMKNIIFLSMCERVVYTQFQNYQYIILISRGPEVLFVVSITSMIRTTDLVAYTN
jgi:hypothetical protein